MVDTGRRYTIYICNMPADALEKSFLEYKEKTEAGEITLPSLPHFLSMLPDYLGEDDLQRYLAENGEKKGTYTTGCRIVKRILQWFRGQYLSNSAWTGAQATKAVLALGIDFGDGIKYAKPKDDSNGPAALQIKFGDSEMSQNAGK